MNRRISTLAMGLATMVAVAQDPQFTSMNLNKGAKESEPDWKRKKCKSCRNISRCHVHIPYKHPNKQACKAYLKRN